MAQPNPLVLYRGRLKMSGEPLPEFERINGEPGDWLDKLERVVRDAGIELLQYEDYLGGAEGVSQGETISVLSHLPAAQKFFVCIGSA